MAVGRRQKVEQFTRKQKARRLKRAGYQEWIGGNNDKPTLPLTSGWTPPGVQLEHESQLMTLAQAWRHLKGKP